MTLSNYDVYSNKLLNEKYYSFVHKSGLHVSVFPKKLTASYAVFATHYGSNDSKFKLSGETDFTEVPDGIAHFLEHKLFENSDGVDTFNRFARYGASANAYTSNTMTAYLFSCTSDFYECLEILLDFVTSPYFTKENVEKEQGIIAQEIKMYEDSPNSRLFRLLLKNMYEKHSIRTDIAGTVDSIAKITPELLYKCYEVFYRLTNMELIVCGNVTPDKVEAVCDKLLGKIPENSQTVEKFTFEEEPSVFRKHSEFAMDVSKPLLALGVKDCDIPSVPLARLKRSIINSVINGILFSESSELNEELYKSGLITCDLAAQYEISSDFAFNAIFAETDEPEKVTEKIREKIAYYLENGFTDEMFEREKRILYSKTVRIFDSTEVIAETMLDFLMDGIELFSVTDVYSTLSKNETEALFRKMYGKEEYYSTALITPLKN